MKKPHLLPIPTLSGDQWCDNDVVMLHACFALLADCIENEHLLDGHVDWTQTAEDRAVKEELETLYAWWNKRKEDEYDDDAMLLRLIRQRRHLWT